jgi:hypothetical protein
VGSKAPRSEHADARDDARQLAPLTTSTHPDRALYQRSVAASSRRTGPFVVVFATPEVLHEQDLRSGRGRRLARAHAACAVGRRLRPRRGVPAQRPGARLQPLDARMGLQSEPWTFLVGRDGRIKAKFEGSVSVRELRAAVQSMLVA